MGRRKKYSQAVDIHLSGPSTCDESLAFSIQTNEESKCSSHNTAVVDFPIIKPMSDSNGESNKIFNTSMLSRMFLRSRLKNEENRKKNNKHDGSTHPDTRIQW